jgi:electron transport complex protein RnfD
MDKRFLISPSPHLQDSDSIPKIMYLVAASLIPAGAGAVYFFGIRVLGVIGVSIAAAMLTEAVCQKMMRRPVQIADGSALVTGILLAYNLPAEVPLWLPAAGAFFGVAVGKMAFGGLGYNPLNPALLGRAFLMASWPSLMGVFTTAPAGGKIAGVDLAGSGIQRIDALTQATPLGAFSELRKIILSPGDAPGVEKLVSEASNALSRLEGSHLNLFLGKIGGCIGETSVLLLLVGAFFLMYRRIIGWKIPFTYIGTVALLSWIFGGTTGPFSGDPLFHILSGGLILGAFFMATDMVTSPVTFRGRLIFGVGCGIITVAIRLWGAYPEGVSYSILLMNLTTPLLDRYTKPKPFGGK